MSSPDQRSAEAQAYRAWYKTARWQRIRVRQLAEHPLCCMCQEQGHITIATVCDHAEPHRGDADKFWNASNLQSLCGDCHDRHKQVIERRGFSPIIGIDGWPSDSAHPANTRKVLR